MSDKDNGNGESEESKAEVFPRKLPFPVEPTNIPGIFAVAAPPDDFDPRTASQRDLLRHGVLLRKPTAADDPALLATWDRFCTRHWRKMVRANPRLEQRPGRKHPPRLRPRSDSAGLDTTQDSWAGGYKIGGGTWVSIIGTWQVPTVSLPPSQVQEPGQPYECPSGVEGVPPIPYDAGPWQSASWIGLGGFYLDPSYPPIDAPMEVGTDILQVGIIQEIAFDPANNINVPNYQAFYEWYTSTSSTQVLLSNDPTDSNAFLVNPGDTICATVMYDPTPVVSASGTDQPMPAQVSLYNANTGKYFSYVFINGPPEGSNWMGGSCEWIVEATSVNPPDDTTFPQFTPPVNFNCTISCAGVDPDPVFLGVDLMQTLDITSAYSLNSCLCTSQLTRTSVTNIPGNFTETVQIAWNVNE